MAETFAVDVEGVQKKFGDIRALDGVTLRVRTGEIYGLLGPNGAGKTTLIRSIVGLVAPDAGTVTVLGRRMPDVDQLRNIGYMTQQAALYPGLSVEENAEFFASINGAEGGVTEALELVRLEEAPESGGVNPERRHAAAVVARVRSRAQAKGAAARRTHRRRRSAAARRALGGLSQDGRQRHNDHRLQPRHGRGGALPAAGPNPVRESVGGGNAGRSPRARWQQQSGRSVPAPGRSEGRVMSAHRVAAITRRLLQQFRRDRRTLALLFIAPIVILGLLGYLIRGSQSVPAVGIANEDQGPLGSVFASALEQSNLISASTVQAPDGGAKLKDGSLVAYIVFPSDFSQRAQAGVVAPEVHLEGSQPGTSAPVLQALQQALSSMAASAPGAGLHFAPQVHYLYGGPGFDTLDYFGAAFIGLVVFFLVFVITIVAFLNERSQGTLERLMASPLRRGEIVLGYMLGFTVLAF